MRLRSPWRPAAPALTLSLLLAGCAATGPTYERPAAPVATHFEDESPARGEAAATLEWRHYFTDTRLQGLIEQALANNRDLRMAAARVQQAQAAYGLQKAAGSPQVVGQLASDRVHLPAGIDPLGLPIQASGYSLGLGFASWELDFWDRVGRQRDAAMATSLASDEAARAAALSLIGQVAQAYVALGETEDRLRLAHEAVDSRRETLRIFRRRVEVGSSSRLQLTQVQTLLTQAESLAVQLEQTRAEQRQALTLLVGAADLPGPGLSLGSQPPLAELRPGLPADLLNARPDILAAEHQLQASHANVAAARAAYFPRISLTTALGTTSTDFNGLFEGASKAWIFAPSIDLPIFDGGRRDSHLRLQQAREQEALAQYDKAVQGAFRDVNNALAARQAMDRQWLIAQTAQAAQAERARLSQLRFEAGSAAFLEVLDAQRDLLAAGQAVVQAHRGVLASRIALYSALGGGSLAAVDSAPAPTPAP